jgi:prolipoprotein diacylglyceryltransferase
MGCTVAHDHPGTGAAGFPLGIYCRPVEGHTLMFPEFMRPDHGRLAPWGPCATDGGVNAAHDMGFYEALWSLGMFGIYWLMDRVPRKAGIYAALLGVSYGPVRFMMDFLRPETTDGRYFGFTPGQYWSVIFFLGCLYVLMRLLKQEGSYWTVEEARSRAEAE